MPRQDHRQVLVIVSVTVAETAAVTDHGVVQQIAFTVWSRLEFIEKVRQLSNMKLVDLADLRQPFSITPVVREFVMTIWNVQLSVAAIATCIRKHTGCDASRVRLKCQHHHIRHQPDVISVIAWDTCWDWIIQIM